jgi:hypothetical protein
LLLFLYKIQKCPPLLEDRTERDIILLWGSRECYERITQVSWMLYGSLMMHTSTWMFTFKSKQCDFRPHPKFTAANTMHPELYETCFSVKYKFLHCVGWCVKVS